MGKLTSFLYKRQLGTIRTTLLFGMIWSLHITLLPFVANAVQAATLPIWLETGKESLKESLLTNIPVYALTEKASHTGINTFSNDAGVVEFHTDDFVVGNHLSRFSETGSYKNLNAKTGSDDRAGFVLPAANDKFRVDADGEQHWSEAAFTVDGQTDMVTADIASISVSISAEPVLITPGEDTTLTWSSSGADSCTISSGIDDVALNGIMQVTPSATTEYIITATAAGTPVTDSVTVVVNTAPTITMIEPDGTADTADDNFTIQWQDGDPEQNAVIDLYYDTDNSGADGILIVSDLLEDSDGTAGSYSWDTSALAEGILHLCDHRRWCCRSGGAIQLRTA